MGKMLEFIMPGLAAKRAKQLAELYKTRAIVKLLESVPEWAQDDDENEWYNLGEKYETYTEEDLQTLRENVKKLYYTNPSARGIIEDMVLFVVGRHATMVPEDEKALEYWAGKKSQGGKPTGDEGWVDKNKWDKRAKEAVRRIFRDGEVFIRFFEAQDGGEIRFIEPDEITDYQNKHSYGIEVDPNDVEKVISYRRTFFRGQVEYHETIPAEEIVHWKILCDSNEKRGVPFLIGVAKYIKQYERWLGDRVRLNRLRNLFNLIIKPEGVTPATFKSSNFSDETTTPSGKTPNTKIPKPGSAVIAQGVDYDFKSLDLNATDTAADGRAIERMICKGTGLVEGVVTGDYSNQSFASSLVAESPMVKTIESWQDEVEGMFQEVLKKIFELAISAGKLPEGTSLKAVANFATMVHRDVKADTEAYQIHKENRWASNKTLSTKLGYDYEDEQAQIKKEDEEEDERIKKMDGYGMPGENPNPNENPKNKEPEDNDRRRKEQT